MGSWRHRSASDAYLEFCECLLEFDLAARDDRDVSAAVGELAREREPEAFGSASDVAVLCDRFRSACSMIHQEEAHLSRRFEVVLAREDAEHERAEDEDEDTAGDGERCGGEGGRDRSG